LEREDYPAVFQAADGTSRSGQAWYRRLTTVDLALLVLAAALGSVSSLAPAENQGLFNQIATVILAASIIIKFVSRQRADDRDWFLGRAIAESAKTQTWRYMMRLSPFEDDASADVEFSRHLMAILEAGKMRQQVGTLPIEAQQITGKMRAIRQKSLVERRDYYIHNRLDDQVQWYRNRSQLNRRIASRWFWLSIGSQSIALAIAILRSALPLGGLNLVAPFAALATAIMAWSQLGRHDELSNSYAMAYQELLTIRGLAETVASEEDFREIVENGEEAISREHTMWIAKRTEQLPPRLVNGVREYDQGLAG
jgi:hypothetical protein